MPQAAALDVLLMNEGVRLEAVLSYDLPEAETLRKMLLAMVRGTGEATEIWQEGLRVPPIRLTERPGGALHALAPGHGKVVESPVSVVMATIPTYVFP